jgi:hypothetical protein
MRNEERAKRNSAPRKNRLKKMPEEKASRNLVIIRV